MARRRRKQGNAGEGLILKAFVTIFTFLVMIGSFLLFAAWWYFERKSRTLPKPNSIDYFAHTADEINKLNQQQGRLNTIYNRLDQINCEGKSLNKRKDGMYNERSKKGKQFNLEITQLIPKADKFEQEIADIESLPDKRLSDWAFYSAMPLALRLSVIFYVVSFMLFLWLQPTWIMQLSGMLQKLSLFDFYSSFPIAYGASVGSLICSLIVLVISFLNYKQIKKDSLTSVGKTPIESAERNTTDKLTYETFMKYVENAPHSELKKLVDVLNIDADKRSRKAILQSFRNEKQKIETHIDRMHT